jgi:NhaA family Na+:H+ antiporter
VRSRPSAQSLGGALTLIALTAALVWSNVGGGSYERVWTGSPELRHWVNDGLLTFFFLVIGLELKREALFGDLRDAAHARLPVVAAAGGMVVPALLYAAINHGDAGSGGWAVPVATDIALAVGLVALLGDRVPRGARLFLIALAVIDDIGGIIVIAIIANRAVRAGWLALIVLALGGAAICLRRRETRWLALPIAVLAWYAALRAGIEPAIVGAAIGVLTPAALLGEGAERAGIERALAPWVACAVVPLFALANAGIHVTTTLFDDPAATRVAAGAVIGLVLGKVVGIAAATWIAVRLGIGRLPPDSAWRDIVGVAFMGGIGFTVALLIADLSFDDPALTTAAKAGILGGSALAAAAGALVLVSRPREAAGTGGAAGCS